MQVFLPIDIVWERCYNLENFSCLRGGVKFPTGGNAAFADEPTSVQPSR